MKYTAKPVEVEAFRIVDIYDVPSDGSIHLITEDNKRRVASPSMVSRYTPIKGDYWVIQSDGCEYVNPKDVFDRKYSKSSHQVNKASRWPGHELCNHCGGMHYGSIQCPYVATLDDPMATEEQKSNARSHLDLWAASPCLHTVSVIL